MIKTITMLSPFAYKVGDVSLPYVLSGIGDGEGVDMQNGCEEKLIPVPDYPETNKQLIRMLCNMIDLHAIDLGEILRAEITRDASGHAYRIYVNGVYANYERSVYVPRGFGEYNKKDEDMRTPLSCLMKEFKMAFHMLMQSMGGPCTVEGNTIIKQTDKLIDDYIFRMEKYEGA